MFFLLLSMFYYFIVYLSSGWPVSDRKPLLSLYLDLYLAIRGCLYFYGACRVEVRRVVATSALRQALSSANRLVPVVPVRFRAVSLKPDRKTADKTDRKDK